MLTFAVYEVTMTPADSEEIAKLREQQQSAVQTLSDLLKLMKRTLENVKELRCDVEKLARGAERFHNHAICLVLQMLNRRDGRRILADVIITISAV